MASVTRGIVQARFRLQESLQENDQLRHAIKTALSESETKMLIAELDGKTGTIKEDFTQSDPDEKLSLPNMMLKLKRLKDHAEATNRENRAIRDVLLACMTEGELRTAMGGDNSSRQSTPSKSDVLDSKEQKVLDVFKERKEQKVKELKEELKEKELKEKWLKEEELTEKEPKEKELKDREQMMKEKLKALSLKSQSQDSDSSSLSARFADAKKKMQIDDNGEKATGKKSLQTHQDWLKDREKKWLLEKEENAATMKRAELSEYQSNAQREIEKYKSQRDHDNMQIVLAEEVMGKHMQNTKDLQLAVADNERKLVQATQTFEHELMVKDELISSIRKSKTELEDRIAAGSTGSIKLERKMAEKEEELQLSNARVKEVELRIKRDTIAMEGLAEKLQEIRKERDASQSRELKQKEMIKVMEELQEELMTSMDPTIKNLSNYKELAGRHEMEIEKKDKEIHRLTYLAQDSTFTNAEKNDMATKVKELEGMVKEQALKLVQYKKVISEEIDTTQLVFMKESEIESLQREVKMLEEKLANSSSTEKQNAGGEDGFLSYKGMMQSLLGDLKGIKAKPLSTEEALVAVEASSVALEKAQEEAKEAWEMVVSLTSELEDERTTRKQLAATLMEFMSTMADDE
mmetsp:Transcript_9651/g.16571  ORF Transcript_9651/g.16571 Transcript_9651/m.16571 type:complete len:635 (+) Transcript_9651:201-2105(+)|eukprot:CAMPEP_0198212846 /NCGR_PEP_ID=MMETSP1445-20131203/27903_1 /TAXON_ID=36898 /ORGANISM="Pyramimonas sp., Strain CCMP2087" /LENGTH=634 /DNA_ID=CAMNT_0043887395 /DNA_START=184 /DNA_END=2088 /DNA_ORIENTATION=+